jgi:hypothetical protein
MNLSHSLSSLNLTIHPQIRSEDVEASLKTKFDAFSSFPRSGPVVRCRAATGLTPTNNHSSSSPFLVCSRASPKGDRHHEDPCPPQPRTAAGNHKLPGSSARLFGSRAHGWPGDEIQPHHQEIRGSLYWNDHGRSCCSVDLSLLPLFTLTIPRRSYVDLLSGLSFMHSHHIAHRSLSLSLSIPDLFSET